MDSGERGHASEDDGRETNESPPSRPEGGGSDDEMTVRRSEEEVRAGTRGREAGAMNVRKSVRTEREEVRVPKRREEVGVERVPMNEEAPGAEVGEGEEIVVQVFEEEVVVTKRVVLKEEIRIRKEVVEDEEVVDVDLRKEEVEIDDQTERGAGSAEPYGRDAS